MRGLWVLGSSSPGRPMHWHAACCHWQEHRASQSSRPEAGARQEVVSQGSSRMYSVEPAEGSGGGGSRCICTVNESDEKSQSEQQVVSCSESSLFP